jgi:phage gp36-like protein
MTYATATDLQQRYGLDELTQLTDTSGAGVPDAAVVALALGDATAEIDGYLSARYVLPLPTVPTALTRITCDIARYRLWADRASDEVRRRYEDAVKLLTNISKGLVNLGLTDTDTAPTPSQASFTAGSARVFGRDNTGAY